jgi:hypothetical protein
MMLFLERHRIRRRLFIFVATADGCLEPELREMIESLLDLNEGVVMLMIT